MENTIEISQTIGVNLSLDIRQPSRFFHLRLGDVTSQLLKPNLSGFKHSRVDKAVDNYPLFYPIVEIMTISVTRKRRKQKAFRVLRIASKGSTPFGHPFGVMIGSASAVIAERKRIADKRSAIHSNYRSFRKSNRQKIISRL